VARIYFGVLFDTTSQAGGTTVQIKRIALLLLKLNVVYSICFVIIMFDCRPLHFYRAMHCALRVIATVSRPSVCLSVCL